MRVLVFALFACFPFGSFANGVSELVDKAAYRYGVDANLVHAVIKAESAYNPQAVSSAGAVGLMQLMPDTAKRYGVSDRYNMAQNIDGGVHYLKDLLGMFKDVSLAVAGYNAGENAVVKYNYAVPPYNETRHYVRRVLSFLGKPVKPLSQPKTGLFQTAALKPKPSAFRFKNKAAYDALAAFYAPGVLAD